MEKLFCGKSVEEVIAQMTPLQKAQMVCGADFWQTAAIESLGIPSIRFSDGPHGVRRQMQANDHLGISRSVPSTCFPTASALACSWNPDLCYQIGRALGEEAAALDVDVLLGPVLNLIENPLGGRNFETFSEDWFLTVTLGSAMVRGIQENVSACIKHFDLNAREKFRQEADERADEALLGQLYQPAFQKVVQSARPDWVMSAYNRLNGVFCCENKELLSETLRDRWHFDGAVVSDWGGCSDLPASLKAGMSLEMPSTGYQSPEEIVKALQNGTLSMEDLEERVSEVLRAVEKAWKRRQARTAKNASSAQKDPFDFDGHHQLAVRAARQSAVLLRNDKKTLPLRTGQTFAWIGPFDEDYPIQGAGSSRVVPSRSADFAALVQQIPGTHLFAQGYRHQERRDPKLHQQAINRASRADVIVFCATLPEQENMEGLDRRALMLPGRELKLIRELADLGKKLVVVLNYSGTLILDWMNDTGAILQTGLAGQGSMEALLELLFGKASPCGQLAQTCAALWSDHPSSAWYAMDPLIHAHPEGLNIGYRYFSTEKVPVLFPFGYGLGYSQVTLRNVRFDATGVNFEIENQGDYVQAKAVQLYVRSLRKGSVVTLRHFERIELPPHQARSVRFEYEDGWFCGYDPKARQEVPMQGAYEVRLGLHAADEDHTVIIERSQGAEEVQLPDRREPLTSCEKMRCRKTESRLDALHAPIELFAGTRARHAGRMIGWMIRRRDRALNEKKPDLVLSALCDMSPNSLAKMYSAYFSLEMAQILADHLQNPKKGDLRRLCRAFRQHRRKSRQWKEKQKCLSS